MIESSLLAKALWSGGIVLALSLIAERVSTRLAGILSGAPIGVTMVYFFVGLERGPIYIAESVPFAIASLTGTMAFVYVYYRASLWFKRLNAVMSAVTASLAFIAISLVLIRIPFGMIGALAISLGSFALLGYLLRRIGDVDVDEPVRITFGLLSLRSGMAALFVVGIITLADSLGSAWTGMLIGFPMTLLPTLFIVHATYGHKHTHTMIQNLPFGLTSLIVYVLAVAETFPRLGVVGGTVSSLLVALAYLTTITFFRMRSKRQSIYSPGRHD
jgi:hypothetical protein